MCDSDPPATELSATSSVREFIVPVLTLIIGVFVLLPTAIGPIGRPFALSWLLPVFIVLAVASSIGLSIALLASNWTFKSASTILHIGHGVGNWAGALSLLTAATFLCCNYWEDARGLPRIVNVKINPVQPEAGKVVEIELEISNRAGVPLAFEWDFDGKKISGLRTAYVKMPAQAGTYVAVASVRDLRGPPATPAANGPGGADNNKSADNGTSIRIVLDVLGAEKPSPSNASAAEQESLKFLKEEKDNGATTSNGGRRSGAPKSTTKTHKTVR